MVVRPTVYQKFMQEMLTKQAGMDECWRRAVNA